ncbi:MAG TPA: PHB depolymerase family esterase [Microthrixaceae bacterium]|nr:PHB depolymerase family esterase [Microthrixaceae bacterium]
MTARALAIVAVLGLVAAGCGGSDSSSANPGGADNAQNAVTTTAGTGDADTDGAEARVAESPGCAAAAPETPGREVRIDLASGGVERFALVTTPSAAAESVEPRALVIDFHGLAEGAEVHARMSQYSELAEQEGFFAVFPQGTGDIASWKAGVGGELNPDHADVEFVTDLLERLGADHCIDLGSVYATGLSNGAMMTSTVGCLLADRFAAVAPVAGAAFYNDCPSTTPMPVYAIHGTQDPLLPFNGGVGNVGAVIAGGAADQTKVEVELWHDGVPRKTGATRRITDDPAHKAPKGTYQQYVHL